MWFPTFKNKYRMSLLLIKQSDLYLIWDLHCNWQLIFFLLYSYSIFFVLFPSQNECDYIYYLVHPTKYIPNIYQCVINCDNQSLDIIKHLAQKDPTKKPLNDWLQHFVLLTVCILNINWQYAISFFLFGAFLYIYNIFIYYLLHLFSLLIANLRFKLFKGLVAHDQMFKGFC